MPDQGDPLWGAEERFAEAVEPGRPSGPPAEALDSELARELEIAGMLRALGPGFSASADAKSRVRARVMDALALDGPPSDGGGLAAARPADSAPSAAPTERLPVVPLFAGAEPPLLTTPIPLPAVGATSAAAEQPTALRAVPDVEEAS